MIDVFIKYKPDGYPNTKILCVHEIVSEECNMCRGKEYLILRKISPEEIFNHNKVVIKYDHLRENFLCIHYKQGDECINCNLGWNDGYFVQSYEVSFIKSLKTTRDLKIKEILK